MASCRLFQIFFQKIFAFHFFRTPIGFLERIEGHFVFLFLFTTYGIHLGRRGGKNKPAFLSKLDSNEIKERLQRKVEAGERLTDEELMEFIILPLTYKGEEPKKAAVKEMVSLAKGIQETAVLRFVLSGIIVFADKVIDMETGEEVVNRLMMTKVDMILQEREDRAVAAALEKANAEKEEALEQARQQKKKEVARASEKAAKRAKNQAIVAFVRDKQEDGVPKERVIEKLMRYFKLTRETAENFYENA